MKAHASCLCFDVHVAPSRPLGVLTARPSAQQSFTAKKSSNGLQWALQDVRMRRKFTVQ